MTDATTTATTAATTSAVAATSAATATPWYQGQADAETVGFWQNKGFDITDPVKTTLALTTAYRMAEKHIGGPPDRLIRLPETAADEAGWKTVYQRLGAPADPKEYDFSAVKHADGSAPAQSLIDAARATAAALHAPKDRAGELATAMVKHLDAAKAESDAAKTQTLTEQKQRLAQSWGPKAEENRLMAMQGARRLGISPEAVAALENQIGYDGVMEAMRKIGAGTSEDSFVQGARQTGAPATAEAAQDRLNELLRDPDWSARFNKGGVAENREFQQLTTQIARKIGYDPMAA